MKALYKTVSTAIATLSLLFALLPVSAQTPKIGLTSTRFLNLRSVTQDNAEASISMESKYQLSNSSFISLSVLYGANVLGEGWSTRVPVPGNAGQVGSGLANSSFYANLLRLGPKYAAIKQGNWGDNGLNFALTGRVGSFNLDALYSGYSNIKALSFSGTAGSFTGTGTVVQMQDKIDSLNVEGRVKF